MTDRQPLAKLADSIMAYDYGQTKTVAAPPRPRDPFEADFGEDPGFFIPPHETFPLHPSAPHQTITVRTPPQKSLLLEFVFQTLAVIAGGYAVQRFIVPRMSHHRDSIAE
jgi:hypothetical protein